VQQEQEAQQDQRVLQARRAQQEQQVQRAHKDQQDQRAQLDYQHIKYGWLPAIMAHRQIL